MRNIVLSQLSNKVFMIPSLILAIIFHIDGTLSEMSAFVHIVNKRAAQYLGCHGDIALWLSL